MYPQLTYFYCKEYTFNFNILINSLSNHYTDYYTAVIECALINYFNIISWIGFSKTGAEPMRYPVYTGRPEPAGRFQRT